MFVIYKDQSKLSIKEFLYWFLKGEELLEFKISVVEVLNKIMTWPLWESKTGDTYFVSAFITSWFVSLCKELLKTKAFLSVTPLQMDVLIGIE